MVEDAGFEVLVTGDQNIYYQQNNAVRRISLVVLTTTERKPVIRRAVEIGEAVSRATPGSFETVVIHPEGRKKRERPSKI